MVLVRAGRSPLMKSDQCSIAFVSRISEKKFTDLPVSDFVA